jgi:hypothetical protein
MKKYLKHMVALGLIVASFFVIMPHFNIGEVSPISKLYSISTCDGMWTEHVRFALTGGHAQGKCSCASCHVGGFYNGSAPNTCIGCHMGGRPDALQKPANHISTDAVSCDNCHTTTVFGTYTMNHSVVSDKTCTSCHGTNQFARGKSSEHIPTTLDCGTCHLSRKSWDATFTHQGVLPGTCNTCHTNGVGGALKMVPTHIPTTESCDVCHSGYTGFNNGTLNHAGVTASAAQCEACHTGAHLGATMKGPQHIANVQNCAACHNPTAWQCKSGANEDWFNQRVRQAKAYINQWLG